MIVVTGMPRSGSSMIMQTLILLGIRVAGEKFDHRNKPEHNPKGYWELPYMESYGGIKDHRYKGMGVKLFNQDLTGTPIDYISKIIFTTRNMNYAAKSYQKVMSSHTFAGKYVREYFKPTRNNAEKLLSNALSNSEKFIASHPEIPVHKVIYEKFIKNPEAEVKRLSNFLELSVDITEAVNNIGR